MILVCKDGRLSATVARMLGVCGFPGVAYLKGGLEAWKLANKPLLKTSRSGSECRVLEQVDRDKEGSLSKLLNQVTLRVVIAGLVLSAALLALLAWALAGEGP